MIRRVLVAIGVTVPISIALAGLALFLVCSGAQYLVETPIWLICGWYFFLARVLPQVTPDWSAIGLFFLAAALFIGGLHWTLRSLATSTQPASAVWRLRWTVAAAVVVGTMFVSGLAAAGLVQQVRWLYSGPRLENNRAPDESAGNLNEMVHRMVQYAELPSGTLTDARGQALHGWQTQLLPMLQRGELQQRIDLARPWSDPHHKEVFATQIELFRIPHSRLPQRDALGYALSHYSANVHVIGGTQRRKSLSLANASSTILLGEAAGNFKPWGHRRNWRDPSLGINASADGFGSPWQGGAHFGFGDGSVRFLNDKIDAQVLRAQARPAPGAEP